MGSQTDDLLQQCQRHFPGLAWAKDSDGWPQAKFKEYIFTAIPCKEGKVRFTIFPWNQDPKWRSELLPPSEALAQAAAQWREFAAKAMAVVGPLPEPKLSPEQQQAEMVITAYVVEGDRRKARGLPPDPQAQARAAAQTIAERRLADEL